jgi:hypothetical protein
MAQKIQGAQRDFSYGEVDVEFKRADDHPARKAGLRQMSNMRIRNSRIIQNRPGRSALFPSQEFNRIEEFTVSPGNLFKVAFGVVGATPTVQIRNAADVVVATFSSAATFKWTAATVNQIVIAQLGLSIYFTYPGMKPQILTWDGIGTWTSSDFNELVVGGQKRTFFYRISPQNITLLPAAQTGTDVVVTASAAIFTPQHVGTLLRFVNRQMLITSFVSPQIVHVTILEALPGHQNLGIAIDPRSSFSVGDVIQGAKSGSKGIITSISSGAIGVQLLSTNASVVAVSYYEQRTVAFQTAETVVGPAGSIEVNSAGAIDAPTIGVTIWDEEVMNAYRGYPQSVFVDNYRLGFCDFPAVPGGIGWSAINSPTDCYVGGPTVPNGAIFELAPDKARVQHVVPGPESSEFVFCDHKVFYIKIDASNPLKPGSVGFQMLSGDGAARVQPRVAQASIFYVSADGNSVMAVMAPGAYYRPFSTERLSEFAGHLFSNIVALAAPNADGAFNERYVYALNGDGTVVCGKYEASDGKLSAVGWSPWSGAGVVQWIAALNADVLFTTNYSGRVICEILDDTRYLDGAVSVNSLPAAMVPAAGLGPLWWLPRQTVSLMDQGTRSMGTYDIDAQGFIVPQNSGGEDLSAASLVAGQPWTSVVEPFCPAANPGADMHQRMRLRQIASFAVYVIHSTGFVLARLFSGKVTRTSPPLGTVMAQTRFSAHNQDDDATLPPPQRETVEQIPTVGSSFDPRVALIKDTPGPLQLLEIGIEVTL